MKWLFTITLSAFISHLSMSQSAWTKPKNEGYFQLQFNTIPEYDEVYSDVKDQSLLPVRLQTEMGFNLYGEYGLSDKLTVLGHVPLKIHKSGELNPKIFLPTLDIAGPEEDSGNLIALGNIEVGARYKLYDKSVVISAQFNVELNTSTFDEDLALRTGYDAFGFTPTINIGKGWNKSYIQAFTGATLRTNDYHQSFKLGVEYGYKLIPKLWAIGFIDIITSFDEGSRVITPKDLISLNYVSNQEFSAYGLKLIYEYKKHLGFNFGFGGAFGAQFVPKKPSMAFGIFSKI